MREDKFDWVHHDEDLSWIVIGFLYTPTSSLGVDTILDSTNHWLQKGWPESLIGWIHDGVDSQRASCSQQKSYNNPAITLSRLCRYAWIEHITRDIFRFVEILGAEILLSISCVNMRWKICVLLRPACSRLENTIFSSHIHAIDGK